MEEKIKAYLEAMRKGKLPMDIEIVDGFEVVRPPGGVTIDPLGSEEAVSDEIVSEMVKRKLMERKGDSYWAIQ